jgi:arylsulfatase A-like enzyme
MPPAIPRSRDAFGVKGLLENLFRSPDHSPPLSLNEIAELRANYAGNVTLIDDQIGAIIDFLKRSNAYDDTLIIFTSDHGEMNGDHGLIYKGNFLASSIEIPLVIKPPRQTQGNQGERVEPLAELIDVGATILDYVGIAPPERTQGRSLRPILEGRRAAHREYVVSEFKHHTMMATQDWKCEFDPDDNAVLLLNRADDPREQTNLVNDPHYDDVRRSICKALAVHRAAASERCDIVLHRP